MSADFARDPSTFRYRFLGMKLNDAPDAIPAYKYALAFNVRAIATESVRTRPGQSQLFATGGLPVTDLRAYTSLNTDDLPRYLVRDTSDSIYLDTGTKIGTLATIAGSPGVSMIPFRPDQSPNPYMYIAGFADYQKFSAPSPTNVVIQRKVGIAEPPVSPQAGIAAFNFAVIYAGFNSPALTSGGTAGANTTYSRVSDTAIAVLPDPSGVSTMVSIQVNTAVQYQRYMTIDLDSNFYIVQDVFPGLPNPINILSIYYFSGVSGRCVVVPANLSAGPGSSGQSLYGEVLLTSLRRGALIQIGSEVCYVWSVTTGPDGTISIETSTIATHTNAETLTALPAIVVPAIGFAAPGQTIISTAAKSTVIVGIGTLTATLSTNPFAGPAQAPFQSEDYMHISFNVDDLTDLNELKILIDVGDGSFTENFYYYTVRPSDLAAAVDNSLTQLAAAQIISQNEAIDEELTAQQTPKSGFPNLLGSALGLQPPAQKAVTGDQTVPGSDQWSEIVFPISAFTRVGNDQTLSLQTANSWQVLINASATVNVRTNSFSIMSGGYQPDVGDVGEPYRYRVRPRSSVTGTKGNPSPSTRYGVNSRRQSIAIALPSAAYDPQIDTWDIERFGGTVTSWRFIGSTPSTASIFYDNYGDDAATAGDELEFDNFEPWPTIDVPLNVTAMSVTGTTAVVNIPGATSPTANVGRYLPGNLVQIGGVNVYTLRSRPVYLSGSSWLFQFEENAGALTNAPLSIYEPAMARQFLPYLFGPDASGTVFAVGDPLRAGTLYFAKNNNPDSAPDSYNIEISPPSEPLIGGQTINGLAYVASPERWWALYPQPTNPSQRFSVVQQPVPRGLAAPFGHCTDGASIFFWAKDGIWSSAKGSLTDADLYNLFPHDGVPGNVHTYNGVSINPPDYSRTGTFRLEYSNSYLYATYQDSSGAYWTLVCDLRVMAWSVDAYSPSVCAFYHPEQQPGTVQSTTTRYPELVMATTTGLVAQQTPNANDLGGPIACILASREYDGGDIRAPKQWGDFFVDTRPRAFAGVVVTPMSLGVPVAAPTTIPTGAGRNRAPVSVGGIVVSDFLGVLATWTDDFTHQSLPTVLYIWQPSFTVQPAPTIAWSTFGTAYGNSGFMHIREVEVAWVSTAPITLAFAVVDGTAPATITIPSSGGAYLKQLFPLTFNKGQLYMFTATSSAPFQFFMEDFEIRVGAWSRQGPYAIERHFGGQNVSPATI